MSYTQKEFKEYLSGKIKINNMCEILAKDIKDNKELDFRDKWLLLEERFGNINSLNLSIVWKELIEREKLFWLKVLPFNKSCNAVKYAARKYYDNRNAYNKEILMMCFDEVSKISKHSAVKELENLKEHIVRSFYENSDMVCNEYLSVILTLDDLYRSLEPQNPDKFLTNIIISNGYELSRISKEIEQNNFFNEVTINLMKKIIDIDHIGVQTLNRRKGNFESNPIYSYFDKYYKYIKLKENLPKTCEDKIVRVTKKI